MRLVLTLVWTTVADAFYRWAQREIHPLHPDSGRLALLRMEVRETRRRFGLE